MEHQEKKKMSPMVIILIVLGVIGFFGVVCCGVSTWLGINAVQDMEKTYYEECEDLQDADACYRCCTDRGHAGQIHGEFLNEEGKLCGCI